MNPAWTFICLHLWCSGLGAEVFLHRTCQSNTRVFRPFDPGWSDESVQGVISAGAMNDDIRVGFKREVLILLLLNFCFPLSSLFVCLWVCLFVCLFFLLLCYVFSVSFLYWVPHFLIFVFYLFKFRLLASLHPLSFVFCPDAILGFFIPRSWGNNDDYSDKNTRFSLNSINMLW